MSSPVKERVPAKTALDFKNVYIRNYLSIFENEEGYFKRLKTTLRSSYL
jgi:hypothetical protein